MEILSPIRVIIIAILLDVTRQPDSAAAAGPNALDIFDNANGDDVIDMRDVTCIERIILGLSPPGPLADARHDNRVDQLDMAETEQIILGKEKSLTLADEREKFLTVPRPVKRVIPEHITSLTWISGWFTRNIWTGSRIRTFKSVIMVYLCILLLKQRHYNLEDGYE